MSEPAQDDPFDDTIWHDNAVHGIRFQIGDPDDWRSDLVLDIDHIVATERTIKFNSWSPQRR